MSRFWAIFIIDFKNILNVWHTILLQYLPNEKAKQRKVTEVQEKTSNKKH